MMLIYALPTAAFAADANEIRIIKFDYAVPKEGENIAAYIAAKKVTIPADAGYTLSEVKVEHEDGNAAFLNHTRYSMIFYMDLKPGYVLDEENSEDYVYAWMNGRQWDGEMVPGTNTIQIQHDIVLGETQIYQFQIDITEPAVGKKPVFKAKLLTEPSGGIADTYLNVEWYESSDESMSSARKMSATDVFKRGKYYATLVDFKSINFRTLPLKDGYYRSNSYAIDIYNGNFSHWSDYTTTYGPLDGESAPIEEPPAAEEPSTPEKVSSIFYDVPENAWYQNYLQKAYDSGIVGGTSSDAYTPNGNLNHGQIMVMAANLHSKQKGDNYDFQANKVAGGAWYQVFEDYCKAEGIIDDRFDGKESQNVTRAEMAYYFANTLTGSSYKNKKDIVLNDITGNAYESEINKLAKADIVGGKGEGKYDPAGLVIRAEAAVFISNILDAIGE